LNKIQQVEKDLLAVLNSRHSEMMNTMRKEMQMSAENEAKLVEIIKNFVVSYKA
jgi:F0F1-type ATP synthase alpha subunit